MILARFKKQPAETRRYILDYSERLGGVETLLSISGVNITPVSETTPLVVAPTLTQGNTQVLMYVSGGVSNVEYKVEVQVKTSDGNVLWEDEVYFEVEDL